MEGGLETQRERLEGWIEVVEAHLEAIQVYRVVRQREVVEEDEEDVEYMGVLNLGIASSL